MNKRNLNDDLIRMISVIFVIMIHTVDKPWENNLLLSSAVTTLIFSCNAFFFMLSGKYSIRKEFNIGKDYSLYYKKKLIEIIFPYVVICALLSVWNYSLSGKNWLSTNGAFVHFVFKELFSSNASTHLWFMFSLIGFLLSAPFFSKMLHNMELNELHIMLGVGFLWNFITIYMFDDFWHKFYYGGWFLSGWVMFFVGGYCIDRITGPEGAPKETVFLMWGGLIGFVINALCMTVFTERYFHATDLAPAFMLFCFGAYIWLEQIPRIGNRILSRVITFVSKHSFSIYLIHYNIANYVTPRIVHVSHTGLRYVGRVGVTFVLSLASAVILDWILNFAKRGMVKVLITD